MDLSQNRGKRCRGAAKQPGEQTQTRPGVREVARVLSHRHIRMESSGSVTAEEATKFRTAKRKGPSQGLFLKAIRASQLARIMTRADGVRFFLMTTLVPRA